MMVLDVDVWTAAHLAAAIRAHRDTMRRQRHPYPDTLDQLESTLVETVRRGQTRPTVDLDELTPDTRPMSYLLTYRDTADALAVSERTVRRLVSDGTLPAVDVAGCKRIHRDHVEALARGDHA